MVPTQHMEAQSQASMPESQKELEYVIKVSQEEEPGLARQSLLRFVFCYCYQSFQANQAMEWTSSGL